MTTELKYLALTAMLNAALWIPYVVAQVMANGFLTPPNYLDPTPRPVPLWGKRADRVYLNAVETFAPFAVLVILIHLTGQGQRDDRLFGGGRSSGCGWCTPIVYWMAIPYIRNARLHARLRSDDRAFRRTDDVAGERGPEPTYRVGTGLSPR
ncbi:MAG: MAPEG family protein [Pseudolabrys sp.]